MKLFEDLPSTNIPITAENLNQIQDKLVVVSATEPTGDNREKVWMQKGKNLIRNFYTNNHYDNEGNTFVSSTVFGRTEYIKVKLNVDYIFSHSLGTNSGWINCFDENFNYIEMLNHNNILNSFKITNTNVKYIMISVYHATNMADDSWMQLEQDSTATEHEEYIEPKIYVKNDNGIYEEFYKQNKEVVLFQGSEIGDINLADSTYNYKYIEVFFSSAAGENDSVKVPSNSNVINCNSVLIDNGVDDDNGYIFIAKQFVNMGTILTVKATGRLFKYQKSSEIIQDTLNQLYINKVIGYKE